MFFDLGKKDINNNIFFKSILIDHSQRNIHLNLATA